MAEYHVSLEIKCPTEMTGHALDRVYDHLLDSKALLAPVMSDDSESHTVGLTYNVEAKTPQAAIGAGLLMLCSALGCKDGLGDAPLVSIEAAPYVDPELLQLVSQAEIARRLRVSREWVRKLAVRPGFPKPAQPHGGRAGLYRWGDVLAWNDARTVRKAA